MVKPERQIASKRKGGNAMSHYAATVIVESSELESGEKSLGDAVEILLEPYNENGEWFAEGSRWDWWVIGGRWEGTLIDKNTGEACDRLQKKDVDWESMAREQVDLLGARYDDFAVNGRNGNPFGEAPAAGETRSEFIQREFEPFYSWAFLNKTGWNEVGQMGWFGQALDEKRDTWLEEYQRLLRDVKDNDWIVVVDCHV
jgi:hypothetical protein